MACSCSKKAFSSEVTGRMNLLRYFGFGLLAFIVWIALYLHIEPFSYWLTYEWLQLEKASSLGAALQFFLYDTPKIFLLLLLMVYLIGWLRADMRVERVRDYLSGKGRSIGYVLGAGFGAITPFCSCSSIPLFLGFTAARIPLGITMAFLITSPLINEIAVVLLWGLMGWKFTVLYVIIGMLSGILGGIILDAIGAERWLQPFLKEVMKNGTVASSHPTETQRMGLLARHHFAASEVVSIVRRVWFWVIVGVGLGAILHGYVPDEWFAQNLGGGQWWSVPLSVAVGIPLYTSVTGVVPIMESLLLKGLPLGTTLAFCMSTVAASLPEILMLKQVMQWKLLAVFLCTLLVLFTSIGWLFNSISLLHP